LRNIKEIIVEYSNEEEFNKEVTRRLNNFCSVCDRELTKEQAMESRRLLREGDGLIAPSCYECRMKRDEASDTFIKFVGVLKPKSYYVPSDE